MSDRYPDAVLALITGINVMGNAAFLPGILAVPAGGEPSNCSFEGQWVKLIHYTRCNSYVTCCTAALGCAVPPMLANEQHAWLKSNEGQLAGWMHVDSETARKRAELGCPTVAVISLFRCPKCHAVYQSDAPCPEDAAKPVETHGHIVLVVPADPTGPAGTYVSAAGAQNFVRALLQRSFGNYVPDYFTHS